MSAVTINILRIPFSFVTLRDGRRRTARPAPATNERIPRPERDATPRRSTAPWPARRPQRARPRRTARAATPRSRRGPDRQPRRVRAGRASRPTQSRRASCRACGACVAPPTHRAPSGARGTRRRGASGRPESAPVGDDPNVEPEPRPLRSVIAAIEGGDVEHDGRSIVEHHAPPRERADRRLRLQVAFARVAHLDLAGCFPLFRREVPEVFVVCLAAECAPQPGQLPRRGAAPAPEPALAFETAEFG